MFFSIIWIKLRLFRNKFKTSSNGGADFEFPTARKSRSSAKVYEQAGKRSHIKMSLTSVRVPPLIFCIESIFEVKSAIGNNLMPFFYNFCWWAHTQWPRTCPPTSKLLHFWVTWTCFLDHIASQWNFCPIARFLPHFVQKLYIINMFLGLCYGEKSISQV